MSLFAKALESAENFLEKVDANAQRALESLEADAQAQRLVEEQQEDELEEDGQEADLSGDYSGTATDQGVSGSIQSRPQDNLANEKDLDNAEADPNQEESMSLGSSAEDKSQLIATNVADRGQSNRTDASQETGSLASSGETQSLHDLNDSNAESGEGSAFQRRGSSSENDSASNYKGSAEDTEDNQEDDGRSLSGEEIPEKLPGSDEVSDPAREPESRGLHEAPKDGQTKNLVVEAAVDGEIFEGDPNNDDEDGETNDEGEEDEGAEEGEENEKGEIDEADVLGDQDTQDNEDEQCDNDHLKDAELAADQEESARSKADEAEERERNETARECLDLQNANDEVRDRLEDATENLDAMASEVDGLNKNLLEAKEILEEVEEELRKRISEVEEATIALSECKAKADAAEAEVIRETSASEEIIERASKQLISARSESERLLAELVSKVDFLETERARLEKSLVKEEDRVYGSAEDAKREVEEALSLLQVERLSHNETKAASQRRTDNLEANVQLAVDALLQAESKISSERKTATEGKERRARAAAELDSVGMEESLLQSRLTELESIVSRLRMATADDAQRLEVDDLNQRLEALGKELSEKDAVYRALFEATGEKRIELEKLSAHSPEAQESILAFQEVERQLLRVADENLSKQAELEAARSENRALHHQIETERSRMRHAQAHVPPPVVRSARGSRLLGQSGEESGPPGRLLRLANRSGYPPAVLKVLGACDRAGLAGLNWLRRKAEFRVAAVVYLVVLHIVWYVLLHWHGVQSGKIGQL